MKRLTRLLSPLCTALLCFSLAFPPNSAYALRIPQAERPIQRAAMEAQLKAGVEQVPLPSPAAGGFIEPEQLPEILRGWHEWALSGKTIPNGVDLRLFKSTATEQSYLLRADFSGSPTPQFQFVRLLETITLVVPDPASLTAHPELQAARRYQATFDVQKVKRWLNKPGGAVQELLTLIDQETDEMVKVPQAQRREQILKAEAAVRGVVQKTAGKIFPEDGILSDEELARRVASLRGQDATRVLEVLRDIQVTDNDEYNFRWWMYQAARNIQRQIDASKKIPANVVRDELEHIVGPAAPFPRVQREVGHLIKQLEEETEPLDADEIMSVFVTFANGMRGIVLETLAQSPAAPVLSAVYYDLYRHLLLQRLRQLKDEVDRIPENQPIPPEISWEALQRVRYLRQIELESALVDDIRENAGPIVYPEIPYKDGQKVSDSFPKVRLGLLIQDKEGRWRFVPGGGGVVIPRTHAPYYNSSALLEWVRPDDLLAVIVYPTIGDFAGYEMVMQFYEGLVYQQAVLPETEIWMGAADGRGLRLLRPNVPAESGDWITRFTPWSARSGDYMEFKSSVEAAYHEGEELGTAWVKEKAGSFTANLRAHMDHLGAGSDAAIQLVNRHLGQIKGTKEMRALEAFAHRAIWVVGEWFASELNREAPLFTEVPLPTGAIPRREIAPQESEEPLDQMGLWPLMWQILDARLWEARTTARWAELHREFFGRAAEAEKKLGQETSDPEQKMWNILIPAIYKNSPKVKSMAQVVGSAGIYEKQLGIELQMLNSVASAARIYQGLLADASQPIPPDPPPLDGTLSAREYFERVRAVLLRVITATYRAYPALDAVGYVTGADRRNRPERVHFGILSVLVAEWMGFTPTRQPISLAKIILQNGVRSVEELPAAPGNPPALLVRLGREIIDPDTNNPISEIAVCCLKQPIRDRSQAMGTLSGEITDQEMAEEAVRWIEERKQNAVEFDPGKIRGFIFSESDPAELKIEKIEKLLELLVSEKALLRSNYRALNPDDFPRQAVVLGRTPDERWAIAMHLHTDSKAQGSSPPAKVREEDVKQVRKQFGELKNMMLLLGGLGLFDSSFIPAGRERAQRLTEKLGTQKIPFDMKNWQDFRPLLRLLLVRRPDGSFLLGETDLTAILNQIAKSSKTFQDSDLRQQIGQMAGGIGREPFLAELNHAVFRGLLLRGELKDKKASVDEVQATLAESNALFFGEGARQAPTALNLARAAYQPLLQKARAAQEKILEGLRAGTGQLLENALDELEQATVQLKASASITEPREVVSLNSRDADQFRKGLAGFFKTLEQKPASTAQGPADPVRLETFRSLVQLLQWSDQGELEKALQCCGEVLPRLIPEEVPLVTEFQKQLLQRQEEQEREREDLRLGRVASERARELIQAMAALAGKDSKLEEIGPVLDASDRYDALMADGRLDVPDVRALQAARDAMLKRFSERLLEMLLDPMWEAREKGHKDLPAAAGVIGQTRQLLNRLAPLFTRFPELQQALQGTLRRLDLAEEALKWMLDAQAAVRRFHGDPDVTLQEAKPLLSRAFPKDQLFPYWEPWLNRVRKQLAHRFTAMFGIELMGVLLEVADQKADERAPILDRLLAQVGEGLKQLESFPDFQGPLQVLEMTMQIQRINLGGEPLTPQRIVRIREMLAGVDAAVVASAGRQWAGPLEQALQAFQKDLAGAIVSRVDSLLSSETPIEQTQRDEVLKLVEEAKAVLDSTLWEELSELAMGLHVEPSPAPNAAPNDSAPNVNGGGLGNGASREADLQAELRRLQREREAKQPEYRRVIAVASADETTPLQIAEAIRWIPEMWKESLGVARDLIEDILKGKEISKKDPRIKDSKGYMGRLSAKVSTISDYETRYPYQAVLALLDKLSEKGYRPNGNKAGMEEGLQQPDEGALMEYVLRQSGSRIRYKESGTLHSQRKNLNSLMGDTHRAEIIWSEVERYPDEIYGVPDELLLNFGAWYSPDTQTLYLAATVLAQASPTLIRTAISSNKWELVQEWAREVLTVTPSAPEPTPPVVPKPAAITPAPVTVIPTPSVITSAPVVVTPEPIKVPPTPAVITSAPAAVVSLPPVRAAPVVESNTPLKEMTLFELYEEFLKPALWKERSNSRWSDFHKELLDRVIRTSEKGSGLLARRAHLTEEEQALKITAEFFLEVNPTLTLQDVRRYADGYGVTSDLKPRFIRMVVDASRIYEGVKADRLAGVPPALTEVDGTRSAEEVIRDIRNHQRHSVRQYQYTGAVVQSMVGFSTGEEYRRLRDRAPLIMMPILVAEWAGLDSNLRPIDLAKAITQVGVERIEVIPASPGNPPALLVHLVSPIWDHAGERNVQALAIALLKEPFRPSERKVEDLPLELTDDEVVQKASLWVKERLSTAVEFDLEQVRSFVFEPSERSEVKAAKLHSLMEKAFRREIAIRSGYNPFYLEKRWRYALFIGRTIGERRATEAHYRIYLGDLFGKKPDLRDGWNRPEVTERQVQEIRDEFKMMEQRMLLLDRLGAQGLLGDPEAAKRVEQMTKRLFRGKVFALQEWELFLPLLNLLFARTPARDAEAERWLIEKDDATSLINRMGDTLSFFREPISEETKQLTQGWSAAESWIFRTELNLAVLKVLLQKSLRKVSLEALTSALVERTQVLDPVVGAGRQSLSVVWVSAQNEDLPGRIEATQKKIERPDPDTLQTMEQGLAELEQAAERLQQLGGLLPATAPPQLRLDKKEAAAFPGQLQQLADWVRAALGSAGAQADPLRLKELRARVESRKEQDRPLQEYRNAVGKNIPLLQSAVMADLARVRELLETTGKILPPAGVEPDAGLAAARLQLAEKLAGWLEGELRLIARMQDPNDIGYARGVQQALADGVSLLKEFGSLTARREALEQSRQGLPARISKAEESLRLKKQRDDNDQILEQSDLQQIARVLLSDDRYAPIPAQDGELRAFLERVQAFPDDETLAGQAQGLRSRVLLLSGTEKGEFRQRFYQALVRVVQVLVPAGEDSQGEDSQQEAALTLAAELLKPRFQTILTDEKGIEKFLRNVLKNPGKRPNNTDSIRNHAEHLRAGASGDSSQFFSEVIRLAELLAGVEERQMDTRWAGFVGVEAAVRQAEADKLAAEGLGALPAFVQGFARLETELREEMRLAFLKVAKGHEAEVVDILLKELSVEKPEDLQRWSFHRGSALLLARLGKELGDKLPQRDEVIGRLKKVLHPDVLKMREQIIAADSHEDIFAEHLTWGSHVFPAIVSSLTALAGKQEAEKTITAYKQASLRYAGEAVDAVTDLLMKKIRHEFASYPLHKAGAEEYLTEKDRAKIPGLSDQVRQAAEALLPDLRRALREKSGLTVLITGKEVPGRGVIAQYSDGPHWIGGLLWASSVSRDKDTSWNHRMQWLRKQAGQKVQVYVTEIGWSNDNQLYINFRLASPIERLRSPQAGAEEEGAKAVAAEAVAGRFREKVREALEGAAGGSLSAHVDDGRGVILDGRIGYGIVAVAVALSQREVPVVLWMPGAGNRENKKENGLLTGVPVTGTLKKAMDTLSSRGVTHPVLLSSNGKANGFTLSAVFWTETAEEAIFTLQQLKLLPFGDLSPLLESGAEEARYQEQVGQYL